MKPEPLYKSIAQELIKSIEEGDYTKGNLLPTEAKLCNKFNVSRVTIRQAIQILVKNEYVKKIQGSGTHIIYSQKKTMLDRSAKIISFSDEMRLLNKEPSSHIIGFELIHAGPQLAEELSLSIGDPVFLYKRVLLGDDFPYCFEKGYLPVKFFPDFTITHLLKSKIEYIEREKGFEIDYSHQLVHAILADETLTNLLKVEGNTPLLEVTHITYDINQVPLEKNCVTFDSKVYLAHFVKVRNKRTE